MRNHWKKSALIFALILYVVTVWVWRSYGFPIGYNTCANANNHDNDCAPYNIYFIALGKIGGTISNSNFINASLTIIAAFITAVATIYIARFTVVLSRVGNQQAADARIIERAYINVLAPQSEVRVDVQHQLVALRVWVIWKNAGRTPAFPMFARIGATFVEHIDNFQFGQPAADVVDPMALGPTAEFSSGHIDIAAVHVLAAENGAGHQFLWGECRYRDTFPGSSEHVLEFCYRIEIDGIPAPPLPAGPNARVRFNLHGEHNRYYDEDA